MLAWDFEMDQDRRNSIPHHCGDRIHPHRCNTSDSFLSTALSSLNLSCNIAKIRICRRITTIVRSSNMRCLDQKGTAEGCTRRRRCTRHQHRRRRRQDLGQRDIQEGRFSNHPLITSGPLMTFCVTLHPIDRSSSSSSRSHRRRITRTDVEDLCMERSKGVYLQLCDVSFVRSYDFLRIKHAIMRIASFFCACSLILLLIDCSCLWEPARESRYALKVEMVASTAKPTNLNSSQTRTMEPSGGNIHPRHGHCCFVSVVGIDG